jgi:2-polyprenyl-6-methoxyphenol hydroxylase-like FAD-dependent oxidoreductase
MKYVVIGGGIAGLAIGAFLERKGKEVIVCEKQSVASTRGHAFLLHDDALSILRELGLDHNRKMPGERISLFSLRRPDGSEIKCEELRSWTCMKRSDLLEYMESLLDPSDLRRGRSFSHFIRQQGKAVPPFLQTVIPSMAISSSAATAVSRESATNFSGAFHLLPFSIKRSSASRTTGISGNAMDTPL